MNFRLPHSVLRINVSKVSAHEVFWEEGELVLFCPEMSDSEPIPLGLKRTRCPQCGELIRAARVSKRAFPLKEKS